MKKKIIMSVGAVLVIALVYVAYGLISSRGLSPKGVAQYTKGDLTLLVNYGRPYKKGRLIFGTKEQGALVPYNQYWRLGANESTEITFNRDVTFGGASVKAGTYRMYAIPSEKNWTIVLNSELGKWGYWEADHALDVVKIETMPKELPESVEMFTIDVNDIGDAIMLNFKWDKTIVSVPVK